MLYDPVEPIVSAVGQVDVLDRADRLVQHRFDELPRVIEVADANEIVRVSGDGLGDIAPPQRIGLDDEEVDEQLVIEPAECCVAHGGKPCRDAFGWIVAVDSTVTARLRALACSRP